MAAHVLIIEDNKKTSKSMEDLLRKEGLEVTTANNGIEGMEKLRRGEIDLVVLDLQMPKMSGDKVLKVMTEDEVLKNIPVLIYTSVWDWNKGRDSLRKKTYDISWTIDRFLNKKFVDMTKPLLTYFFPGHTPKELVTKIKQMLMVQKKMKIE
ncbi:MAG: response regulator [Elusimicrobiota bacterium]